MSYHVTPEVTERAKVAHAARILYKGENMKHYQDGLQGTIEAQLLKANLYTTPRGVKGAMVDSEQITGATMMYHNIPYDEARARVEQALKSIKVMGKERK